MRASAILFVIIAAGCAGEYDVRISLDSPSLRDGARLAEVGIVADCSDQPSAGPIMGDPVLSYDLSADPPRIGDIEPGFHGLFARLVSAECEVLAAGCVPIEVEARGSGSFVVPVRPASGPACGGGEVCDLGRCVPGNVDASVDAADAMTEDVGSDAGTCAVPCTTTNPCEVARCDGENCIISPKTDGDMCPAGQCHAGVCCTGCWNGTACQDGDEAAACGTAGGACAECSCPLSQCDAGACTPQAPFRSVSFSLRSGCFVLASGAAYCAGYNETGQLGDGTITEAPSPVPVRVGDDSDWTMISAGFSHTCGIREGNELYCWGERQYGQLGVGSTGGPNVASPLRVDPDNRYDHVETKYNQSFTIARRIDGVWVAFGRNTDNRLNMADPLINITVPTRIQTPPRSSWQDIRLGNSHICGLATNQRLYCWGANQSGQLGVPMDGALHPMTLSSGEMWDEIRLGSNHTCARRRGEGIHCMGANGSYVLGRTQGSIPNTLLPMDTPGFIPMEWIVSPATQCAFSSVGDAVCWGQNDDAELGFGHADNFGNALVPVPHFADSMGTLTFGPHALYVYDEGNLVWGGNRGDSAVEQPHYGRLGLGHTDDTDAPTVLCIPE